MCCRDSEKECCHPEEQRKPKECTPQQIKECHGDVAEDCCETRVTEQQ